ncbi:MAG: hypothetical protein FVQ83_03540 [Chloroflexi bacterium]|nr:hypothetical protein [Chloroflexota bacterium]
MIQTYTTISKELLIHSRNIYSDAIKYLASNKKNIYGFNGRVNNALSAYILSVASFEAFFNELFFTKLSRHKYQKSAIWDLGIEWLSKLPLEKKVVLMSQSLFGDSFKTDSQPYQDFHMLVRVRNSLVHYKHLSTPNFIKPLIDRNIALPEPVFDNLPEDANVAPQPWTWKISSTEGIRWSINTVCYMVKELGELISSSKSDEPILWSNSKHFSLIEENLVKNLVNGN